MRPQIRFLVVLLALLSYTCSVSAQSFTLSGKVLDEQGDALEFATVACVSQGKVAFTNLKGEYSITLQSSDSVSIRYSMVGYQTKTRVLHKPRGKQTLVIHMTSDNQLDEVVITEVRRQTTQTQQLDAKDMKTMPSATGNAVEELIQGQAGVSTHSELSSQYNVASLLGASGYVGIAGKKLSWTNGLRYKTNRYLLGSLETHGEYNPNFFDYQTYLSYSPNKRWTIDLIGNISENHYNFTPEDRETNFGTMENVKNFKVYFDGKEKDLFRTYFGTLSITRHLTDQTSVTLLGSAFSTKEQETYDIQGQYWLTQTETSENLGVGTYMEHTRNYLEANVKALKLMLSHKVGKHQLESAVLWKNEHIKENSREYEMRDSAGYSVPHTGTDLNLIYTLNARNELNANRIEAYLQDTYRFSNSSQTTFYTLNYGVRVAHWNFNGETIVSPRISLGIVPSFNEDMTFRVATGLYYQAPFFKELRDTTTIDGITYATLNDKIKSQRSLHFIGAYDYRFKMRNQNFKFSAELYYKAMSNLVPYSVNNVKVVYYGQNEASGHAAGLDLKLYGEFVPGTDSWLSVSVMDTKMKLHGKRIAMPTDQRYSLSLFFSDYFPNTERWKMSLKLAYADGLPFSAPHRELESNDFRAPAYKRADIGMSYRALNNEHRENAKNPIRNIWLGLDCLNLFGINNVNSYYWITDVTNQQYAVPNYLTGRQINARVLVEF